MQTGAVFLAFADNLILWYYCCASNYETQTSINAFHYPSGIRFIFTGQGYL